MRDLRKSSNQEASWLRSMALPRSTFHSIYAQSKRTTIPCWDRRLNNVTASCLDYSMINSALTFSPILKNITKTSWPFGISLYTPSFRCLPFCWSYCRCLFRNLQKALVGMKSLSIYYVTVVIVCRTLILWEL